jgi:GNAT superfamily N-acetyltransferase
MNVEMSSVAAVESAPNFAELAAEYASEASIEGMPPPVAKWETYRQLESVGMLHVIRALHEGKLIGFISLLAPVLPHYSVPVAVSESFFVAKAYRKTGAGLKLLRAAEDKARELGSPGLLVSAPFEGDLFHVLPRVGYAETNRVFFKRVANV